jgi:hypothetical protein
MTATDALPVIPTDEQVASKTADAYPGSKLNDKEPSPVGNAVYSGVLHGIRYERERIAEVLRLMAIRAGESVEQAKATAAAATLAGDLDAYNAAINVCAQADIGRRVLELTVEEITAVPGSCPTCKGRKKVRSALVPGQTVPCGACAGPGGRSDA